MASPGSAPSTYTGPATGLTLAKSSFAMSATVDFAVICPPDESTGLNSTVSPGAIRAAGGLSLFQPKWDWCW